LTAGRDESFTAVLIALDAAVKYFHKYAELAHDTAVKEDDPGRKKNWRA